MSISSEITRLQNAKTSLKTAINNKANSEHQITNEKLDSYASFINTLPKSLNNTVTFMNEGNVYQVDSVKSGFGVYAPTINPTKTDYTFKGWGETEQATSYITFPYIPLSSEKILYSIFAQSGRLPSEYQEVEYLESTGTQYIDTGVKPNQDTNITISYSNFGSRAGYLFGAYPQNNFINSYGYYLNTTGDYGNPFWHFNQNVRVLLPFKQNAIIKVLNKELYVDDEKQLTYSGQDFSCSLNLYLFAANWSSTVWVSSSKINYCKIWDGTTLVRDFIPCYRKTDSVAGMYDIVNNVFYTNQGTGTFIVGPDVN